MSDTLSAIVSTQRKTRSHPALYVGLAGDSPRTPAARIGLRGVDRVELRRGTARRVERTRADGADVTILELADPRMSSQHARLSRVGTSWVLEDQNAKNGTWVGAKRVTRHPLEDGDVILVGHTAVVYRESGGEAADLDPAPRGSVPGLDTLSVSLAHRFAELTKAARDRVPVEIHGESGTGKELIARAVHTLSGRAGKFVAINCGSLPSTLLEGELFGHKKGAYTGAAEDRAGLVRSADGGTLFLDEVAELPASSQTALLRVLQEGEVTPLGGDKAVKVEVRLVTATHRDLDADVTANKFRADLRARMLGVTITLPPLRERREDLGLLVSVLLDRLAPGRTTAFSADAVAALYAYSWPLNVRELERCLAAALAISGDRIELEHLPAGVRAPRPAADVGAAGGGDDDALREQLTTAIARHDGNLAAVARELGKDRTQIRRWMKRYGLSRTDDSDADG